MKLASVEFDVQVTIPGVGVAAAFRDHDGGLPLSYDPTTDMVAIGPDGYEVPRSRVVRWKRDRSKDPPQAKVKCEVCAREFNNAKALGGHQRQSGHKGRAV